jgi:hypothetical protein
MPIVHSFHPEENLVVSVWTGIVPDAEAVEAYDALYSHEQWTPGMDELADLSEADLSKISTDGLRAIAKLVRAAMKGSGKEFRSAIIAPDDLGFALIRMYGLINEESKEDANVFRTPAEACSFLGVKQSLLG